MLTVDINSRNIFITITDDGLEKKRYIRVGFFILAFMVQDSPPISPPTSAAKAAISAGAAHVAWIDTDGVAETLAPAEAARRIGLGARPLVCHAKAACARLDVGAVDLPDVLELFAFVHPARFCLPTPSGLAQATGAPLPQSLEGEAAVLADIAARLLAAASTWSEAEKRQAVRLAWVLHRVNWPWALAVLDALGAALDAPPHSSAIADGLRVWNRLAEWTERGPEPAPDSFPVEPVEARARLKQLLGGSAEKRPEQVDYAQQASAAFMPRQASGEPRVVIAEAGTGVGKTLGYIAPASVWAQKNQGAVWISTYTRNLQRQLDGELDRLYPDTLDKQRKVVIRKGRENYFCLLNFEDAVRSSTGTGVGGRVPATIKTIALMARWALATRDGDMVGGDFPSWLEDLLGRRYTLDLTDTRGECVYAACPHYRKCFVERSIRRARTAEIVVANHALVMVQAALGGSETEAQQLPTRYVFDEGHQLFDAADGAFSAHLSGRESHELRRWLLGPEDRQRTRGRGLKSRLEDIFALDDTEGGEGLADCLTQALHAARCLPAFGWQTRLGGGNPVGEAESFLALVHQQVLARQDRTDTPYSLDAPTHPLIPGLLDAARALDAALHKMIRPLGRLIGLLYKKLNDETADLESSQRQRIEGACRSLERRALTPLNAWGAMLRALEDDTPPEFVDWFTVERSMGRDVDLGLYRHWTDPMVPFAEMVLEPAHGALVTSATLTDVDDDGTLDWATADIRSGARHLAAPAIHAKVTSPFDYPKCTRVYVAGDVNKNDPGQVSSAYRELFLASNGGGLGLFTAINRLRTVHSRIASDLEDQNIRLYGQHVDAMDTGTLIDVFRAEENSCLLGTDAVRDGIDVPGRSLRLIAFDRVPWPRPDILHKARRAAFGGRAYEEMLTRLKLKQAYGRLIRRQGDKGVFVMLDKAMPTRLGSAFPDGVELRRIGMKDILAEVREFLAEDEG